MRAIDDSSLMLRRSESRSKGAGESVAEHIFHGRSRKSAQLSGADQHSIDGSIRRTHYGQPLSHLSVGGASVSSGKAPVTPVDFTFHRRRHESASNTAGYGSVGGETSGVTISGRRVAQAIVLDGLENASQEVYATLLEMAISKEINDRNRYTFPDLIIIAIFRSPNVPDNIPKQLLDYFAINGSYQSSTPQPRIQPAPPRKHAFFRRAELDDFSKRMKAVTVSNDMMRYIRDVVVGIRTHEAVHGGLTARAALDLEVILKALAAIFYATFVTPDLVTIAAEKVFAHRLELKSSKRRKMLAANRTMSSPSSTPMSTLKQRPSHAKEPLRGYQGRRQRQEAVLSRSKDRRNSTSSEQSAGGASFLEYSDSEETSGGSASDIAGEYENGQEERGLTEEEDETTAADVVHDVLRTVFPPI